MKMVVSLGTRAVAPQRVLTGAADVMWLQDTDSAHTPLFKGTRAPKKSPPTGEQKSRPVRSFKDLPIFCKFGEFPVKTFMRLVEFSWIGRVYVWLDCQRFWLSGSDW